jgi:hypothetical protein
MSSLSAEAAFAQLVTERAAPGTASERTALVPVTAEPSADLLGMLTRVLVNEISAQVLACLVTVTGTATPSKGCSETDADRTGRPSGGQSLLKGHREGEPDGQL